MLPHSPKKKKNYYLAHCAQNYFDLTFYLENILFEHFLFRWSWYKVISIRIQSNPVFPLIIWYLQKKILGKFMQLFALYEQPTKCIIVMQLCFILIPKWTNFKFALDECSTKSNTFMEFCNVFIHTQLINSSVLWMDTHLKVT
jgi:hypothetical protein